MQHSPSFLLEVIRCLHKKTHRSLFPQAISFFCGRGVAMSIYSLNPGIDNLSQAVRQPWRQPDCQISRPKVTRPVKWLVSTVCRIVEAWVSLSEGKRLARASATVGVFLSFIALKNFLGVRDTPILWVGLLSSPRENASIMCVWNRK